MVRFNRWTTVTVLLVLLIGIAYALPNLIPASWRDGLPGWAPGETVSLGLDLQGGSYLLLEVDLDAVDKERLEALRGDIRATLRKARIGYADLEIQGGSVSLRVLDSARTDEARTLLNELTAPVNGVLGLGQRDYQMEQRPDGGLVLRMSESYSNQLRGEIVAQSIEVVRRRIDELGTKEPTIQRQGDDRILVQVPGLQDPARLKDILGRTAKMTFRLVDTRASLEDALRGRVPVGSELMFEDNEAKTPVVIERRVMVSGDRLVDARASFDQRTGEPVVTFRFDGQGAKKFGDVTKENVGRPFAIVLDGKVISAPVIREAILGGTGQISGSFTVQSANDLSVLLRAGALPAPLKVLEERTVGAELGADSVTAGAEASIYGMIAVVLFMLAAYGLFGAFAAIALTLNLTLILGALTMFQATLTLPGIAGIVLTIGMAVDANVLVFERIREETASGKTPIAAIEAGYRRALSAITDSNLTTLLAVLILFQIGSGPVRGFAVTLGIGIVTSVFSALMVTRLMVATWLRQTRPKTLTI